MADAKDELTTGTLAEAEKLVGLELTESERALVLETIGQQVSLYRRLREHALPNESGPATGFDPRLPGMEFDREVRAPRRSDVDPGPLPGDDAQIAFAPLVQLSRWIERGDLTAGRLLHIYLERLARHGPTLECVVNLTEQRALAAAARADEEIAAGRYRGPLHGIPWGAKDLLDTAAVPTTFGAAPYRDRVPERDAVVVQRLDEVGAVLVAKLSLGELAMGDVWYGGRTRNPWKPERGSGGSSAGPAAATAAGLVGFSIGSETLGSIANPSMVCGTVGLRPTFGRVPRTGAMALCWSLDKLGPIARCTEDTALVLDAIHGPDPGDADSSALPFHFDAAAPVRGRRVGYVASHFEGETVLPAQRAALEALSAAGAELVEIDLPDLPYEIALTFVFVEAAAAFQELTLGGRDAELRQQEARSWPNAFRTAHFVSAVEYVQMQRLRRRMMEWMRDLCARVEIVAAPDMGRTFSMLTNLTGHPALTLPVGFAEDETPVALTLHGRLYDEGTLCRLGMALEAEIGLGDRLPPLS
jgi:Asp-tRNA(Asn)/Glu-tRNA(Gln) amidotransferase A subunit family amidase